MDIRERSILLSAIACEGKTPSVLSQDFISKHSLPAASSVSLALKTLLQREFVYKYNGNYIVDDRFFGMWLRRNRYLFEYLLVLMQKVMF